MKQMLTAALFSVALMSYLMPAAAADSADAALKPGTVIKFGRYFSSAENKDSAQAAVSYKSSSNSSSGKAEKEPIEWKILETEPDGTLLLASVYSIDGRVFNEKRSGGIWEKSSIRKWLNTEFFQQAFNEKERKAVLLTKLKNSRLFLFFNKEQTDTKDQVFLLSVEEAKKYFTYSERIVPATDYAAEHLCRNLFGEGGRWWLRTSGFMPNSVCYVDTEGMIFFAGGAANEGGGCVRPAIRINPAGLNLSVAADSHKSK